ncbi:Myc protein [Lucilia cuprina]|nr:Myc protein [Lucilia cuprina]
MAKLCSPYGTSPNSSFLSELSVNGFSDDFHRIQPDSFDLIFDDLPSIYGDIQKMESDNGFSSYGSDMDLDMDVKTEVRNTDLMWWTAPPTTILSTSASSMSSDISSGVSLAAVMGGSAHNSNSPQTPSLQIKVEKEELYAPTVVTAKKVNPMKFKQDTVQIKQEPTDDVEQQLAHHQIPNSKTTPTAATQTTSTQQPHPVMLVSTANINNIPPGTSLLRKSQQQQQQKKSQQQTRGTLHITKRGDQLLPSANAINTSNHIISTDSTSLFNTSASSTNSLLYQRPDTPHSLDDDCSTTEFKHNVDLRACVMGSNNISLTEEHEFVKNVSQDALDTSKKLIDTRRYMGSNNIFLTEKQEFVKNVSQELQDTSKKQIDTRLAINYSFVDVLDVINNTGEYLKTPTTTTSSSSSGFSSYHSAHNNGSMRSSESVSDEESTMGSSSSSLLDEISYGAGGVSPVSSQSSNSSTQHYMQHRDHSYTRCKDGMDDLSTNLETPSDSEEEIDVVSINDKKLPTNPSDKDRRVLQTKVADKFSAARIVKNPNGLRTIPPRRGSYEFPYTPASSSPVKSVNNSRFPSPSATPYQNQYTTKYVQQQQQMMAVVVSDSSTGVPINTLSSNDKITELSASVTSVVSMPPTKKHRGKKTKHLVTAVQLPNGILKRHYSVDETADTIEKRNLHNDMERQRRIGLKNLFEALKKQIPSIKDKERAPKVNILREAAKLCEALTREDQQLMEQKAKLKEELRRKREILAKLRAAQQLD